MKKPNPLVVARVCYEPSRKMTTQFSTVDGYFLQDEERTKAKAFDFKLHNFGLKPFKKSEKQKTQTLWQRLETKVEELNANSNGSEKYKLLFLGRNSETSQAGAAKQNDDGFSDKLENENRQDPSLTQMGARQAKELNLFWLYQLLREDMSLPQSFYSGPQKKCLETAQITYSNLAEDESPLVVTVKDKLRTRTEGSHAAARRSTKSEIQAEHPTFNFEKGFAENDELWEQIAQETEHDDDERMSSFLEELFDQDTNLFISLTVDAGTIAALLRVVGHREFNLPPAHIIPVLVKQAIKR